MNKFRAALAVIGASVLAFAGVASASTPTPAETVTTLTTSAVSQMTPVLIALATGLIGLAVISWGVRSVLRAVKGQKGV